MLVIEKNIWLYSAFSSMCMDAYVYVRANGAHVCIEDKQSIHVSVLPRSNSIEP